MCQVVQWVMHTKLCGNMPNTFWDGMGRGEMHQGGFKEEVLLLELIHKD